MKKLLLAIFMVLVIAFTSTTAMAQVYVTDAYGTERIVNYGSTYVYVEVDGEWMKTRLYSTMCPTCGHYFDCWHRHYRYSTYTIPSYATVGLYWYFIRPTLAPTIYYRHYPVHVHYSYPVYVDYYRVHHHYPAHHVHHSHPAPAPKHHAAPAHKPEPSRSTAQRSTTNTRATAPIRSQSVSPNKSYNSSSVRTSSPTKSYSSGSKPTSSSSVRTSSPNGSRPSSTRTQCTRTTTSTRR